MTSILFYIMNENATGDRYGFTCRLVEKIWRQGRRIYLHTNSRYESNNLDRLLWTFRQNSFIPHGILGETDPKLNPVQIGNGTDAGGEYDVLINLATEVPEFFNRFETVAEAIGNSQEEKRLGRNRYRFYRDQGYTLKTHKIE